MKLKMDDMCSLFYQISISKGSTTYRLATNLAKFLTQILRYVKTRCLHRGHWKEGGHFSCLSVYYSLKFGDAVPFFFLRGVGLTSPGTAATSGLLYSPRWQMMVIVEQSVEWRLAGETEVLGENLPQRHLVQHKSYLTRPVREHGPPRWEASD
jgi:hypothetical protein